MSYSTSSFARSSSTVIGRGSGFCSPTRSFGRPSINIVISFDINANQDLIAHPLDGIDFEDLERDTGNSFANPPVELLHGVFNYIFTGVADNLVQRPRNLCLEVDTFWLNRHYLRPCPFSVLLPAHRLRISRAKSASDRDLLVAIRWTPGYKPQP